MQNSRNAQQQQSDAITEFRGEFAFLSNFYPALVRFAGDLYPTVENAYQASKADPRYRGPFLACTPANAKRIGRTVPLRDSWLTSRPAIMKLLLDQKFRIPELRSQLLATGTRELIEGNTWGDTYWGVCNGEGDNMLGWLLMLVRHELRAEVMRDV